MRDVTLCFLTRGDEILLGLKKRGFGKDKFNGFGGKLNNGESIEQAVIREMYEETTVKVNSNDLNKVGELIFRFPESKKDWNQKVHVFFINRWDGEPIETEEMKPVWIRTDSLPFEKMWADDKYWLPMVLDGKIVKGDFSFAEDAESFTEMKLDQIGEWQ